MKKAYRDMANRKRKNFSLVELLVVISIISLLIGLLLPALRKVRDKSYSIGCFSNLSMIAKAHAMYSNDYQNWLLPAQVPRFSPEGISSAWMAVLSETSRPDGGSCSAPYGIKFLNTSPYKTNVIDCPAEKSLNGWNSSK